MIKLSVKDIALGALGLLGCSFGGGCITVMGRPREVKIGDYD